MIPLAHIGSTMAGYLTLLLVTLLLELLVVAALAPRALRRRSLLVCLFLNLLTHPLATLVFVWQVSSEPGVWLLIEVVVTLSEYLGYRIVAGLSVPRAALLTVSCNLLTAMLSLFL